MTRRVLVVAYYFPPLGGIGSVRMTRFAENLPEYGWQPTVLAPRNGAYYRDDALHFPEERIIRTPSIELSRMGKRVLRAGGDDTAAADVGGAGAAVRSLARGALYFPDAQVGWYLPAVATALRRLRGQTFDAMYSSSFPITAHLVARRLHRFMGVPWVAEFRDPWSEMMPPGRNRHRADSLERRIAKEADGRIMTSPSWAALHAGKWGRDVTVLPNGHDDPATVVGAGDGRFTIAYLGSYYPSAQRLDAVWPAISRLNREGAPGVDRILFIGDLHPAIRQKLEECGLGGITEVTGFVPHADAQAVLERSSALLVAGPIDAAGILRGQVAAKLAEYLATDLPIIYVGDPHCDAADLLRRYPGTHIVATDDVDGVLKAVRDSYNRRFARDAAALSRRALAGQLADALDRACAGRRS